MNDILSLVSIRFTAAASSWIPQLIFLPYGMITRGLNQSRSPWLMIMLGTLGGAVGSMLIWILDGYIDPWIQRNFNSKHQTFSLPKRTQKILSLHEAVSHKRMRFPIIFIAVTSPIPDIVTVRYVRKKVARRWFLITILVAKFFVYFPFVFGVEWISQWLSLR